MCIIRAGQSNVGFRPKPDTAVPLRDAWKTDGEAGTALRVVFRPNLSTMGLDDGQSQPTAIIRSDIAPAMEAIEYLIQILWQQTNARIRNADFGLFFQGA